MKTADWMRLLIALLLAGVTSYGLLHFGFGAVGAWLLGTAASTLFFSTAGGVHRLGFAAVAMVPPFLINRASEIGADWRLYRTTRSPSQAFQDMFLDSAEKTSLAFGMFVALPLIIVWGVNYRSQKRERPLKPPF
jgi:hypothetical protein